MFASVGHDALEQRLVVTRRNLFGNARDQHQALIFMFQRQHLDLGVGSASEQRQCAEGDEAKHRAGSPEMGGGEDTRSAGFRLLRPSPLARAWIAYQRAASSADNARIIAVVRYSRGAMLDSSMYSSSECSPAPTTPMVSSTAGLSLSGT